MDALHPSAPLGMSGYESPSRQSVVRTLRCCDRQDSPRPPPGSLEPETEVSSCVTTIISSLRVHGRGAIRKLEMTPSDAFGGYLWVRMCITQIFALISTSIWLTGFPRGESQDTELTG